MKKQIIQALKQALKEIGKFLVSAIGFFLLFCILIIAFARGFFELNPDQYRTLKNGLLFLLFFIIAIPIKFKSLRIKEKVRQAIQSMPKINTSQLIGFGWLIAKIVLWGFTLLYISFWVSDLLSPEFAYPDGYNDIWKDLELLFSLSAAFVSIRLIVLHLYPQFSYSALIENTRKVIEKRKIPPFFAILSFILLMFSIFITGNLFFGTRNPILNWSPKKYNEYGSVGTLTINKFSPDLNMISGTFLLNTSHPIDMVTLSNSKSLIFDGKNLPINAENHNVYADVEVEISGNDYLFPFNKYEVEYLTFYPEGEHFEDKFDFEVKSNLTSIVLEKNYEMTYNISPYSFFIQYSLYFKLLVITIGIAFVGFFIAVVMAKTRNQIVELSIGTFAALIAIRGFLIPSNVSSPILLDQLFLLYIILLLVVFLLKINQLKWEQ